MDLEDVMRALRHDPELAPRIAHWHTEPARLADLRALPPGLEPRLRAALGARGIERLYSHQAEAFDHAQAGRDVAVVTPTASGKTLCYNLPVLDRVLRDPEARALYIFPTKALSQDQVAELGQLIEHTGAPIRTYTYDGDTPPAARRRLREEGHVVVTNPHMLHAGILPNHPKWVNLFQNLQTVVIDELHTYRGVFGSHVANVIRRLRRIAAHYGSRPRFVACSATIGNPGELARKLLAGEGPIELIERSGAPSGERHYALWNPPIVEPTIGLRRRAVDEVRKVCELLVPAGIPTIVFARSRSRVEVILKYLKDDLARRRLDPARVVGYRGGYLPRQRRRIERGLRAGDITCVVATNALELGVDIGSLTASVLAGWPGSLASFFQQTGRAGRRGSASLAIMVARSLPLDQYVLAHPDYLFGRPQESGIVDPDNVIVRVNHIKCSAFELPFEPAEAFGPAEDTPAILDFLDRDAAIVHRSGERYYWMADAYPADGVSLTKADVDNFVVLDAAERKIIAEVDRPSAMTQIHEGAIYGLQGDQFVIEKLDYGNRRAYARRVNADYFTEAEADTAIRVLTIDHEDERSRYGAFHGEVNVTTVATIYKKIKFYTHENVGAGEINLPPESFDTEALWLRLCKEVAAELGLLAANNGGALLGAANLLGSVAPLFVRCDPSDVRVACQVRSPHFDAPAIYLYDNMPDGVGLAERAFTIHAKLLQAALDVVTACPCDSGCPGCVGLSREIGPTGKTGARSVLQALLP